LILPVIAVFLLLGGALYVTSAPQFGAPPDEAARVRFMSSPQFRNGHFENRNNVTVELKGGSMFKTLMEYISASDTRPAKPLPVADPANQGTGQLPDSAARVTWYGHSAIFLELEGKRLLIDPMLGPAASPLPIFGKRFSLRDRIDMRRFSRIDAVIISHDHYDHLDFRSIRRLKQHVRHFYVPLGVGSHLRRWGVAADRITELDWWESVSFDGIELTATPAQHFSGRGLSDRNSTLWASWVIKGRHSSIFFSGDSGYGPHFREIGDRFGPFDLTMMECGQYNEKWANIHSMPEQSVQAHRDLRGKVMMPIHWGAFQLAVHPWTEPPDRAAAEAAAQGVTLITPMIGEAVEIGGTLPLRRWWKKQETKTPVQISEPAHASSRS